jgi:norsolorinic acid ketoreductase
VLLEVASFGPHEWNILLTLDTGLGKGLVAAYVKQADNVVVAAVRNPDDGNSKSLHSLPRAASTTLIVVKIDSNSTSDAAEAVTVLETQYNITSLDVVIANAAISQKFPRMKNVAAVDLLSHYRVNVVGVILLFQAVLPLLQRSDKIPKFIAMSSETGTIGNQEKFEIPNGVYGPTKASLNWIMKKVHLEHENIVAFPAHPG